MKEESSSPTHRHQPVANPLSDYYHHKVMEVKMSRTRALELVKEYRRARAHAIAQGLPLPVHPLALSGLLSALPPADAAGATSPPTGSPTWVHPSIDLASSLARAPPREILPQPTHIATREELRRIVGLAEMEAAVRSPNKAAGPSVLPMPGSPILSDSRSSSSSRHAYSPIVDRLLAPSPKATKPRPATATAARSGATLCEMVHINYTAAARIKRGAEQQEAQLAEQERLRLQARELLNVQPVVSPLVPRCAALSPAMQRAADERRNWLRQQRELASNPVVITPSRRSGATPCSTPPSGAAPAVIRRVARHVPAESGGEEASMPVVEQQALDDAGAGAEATEPANLDLLSDLAEEPRAGAEEEAEAEPKASAADLSALLSGEGEGEGAAPTTPPPPLRTLSPTPILSPEDLASMP
ncbi:hypothetical protein PAPYR_2779 [Paratrimastix pyriformis]|uniref:Uncharacterized protein n=1 Tax=Paratrimastix pyriformis TaxID=342808 RepID=A0ABQ8UP21_9EUKA|nr:hypothetical protein PAPYR_2779 [Paratrimastix pyriformis]